MIVPLVLHRLMDKSSNLPELVRSRSLGGLSSRVIVCPLSVFVAEFFTGIEIQKHFIRPRSRMIIVQAPKSPKERDQKKKQSTAQHTKSILFLFFGSLGCHPGRFPLLRGLLGGGGGGGDGGGGGRRAGLSTGTGGHCQWRGASARWLI